MNWTKKFKAYVLIDPITEIPRYVGVTTRGINQRFSGHMSDINNRPELNKHKTAWFKKLLSGGKLPRIEQIAEFDNEQEMLDFEKEYIRLYREKYNLINQTDGGETISHNAHSRNTILKRTDIRPVVQYNVLGEKIAEYELTEDVRREFNLRDKACSHITGCCKGVRKHAYGYIWRYKGDPLGDISNINPRSLYFNKLVQYDSNWNRLAEYDSYVDASKAIGDNSKGGNIASVACGDQVSCKGYYFQIEPTFVYFDQSLFEQKYLDWKTKEKKSSSGITIYQYDLDGNFIKSYSSIIEASVSVYGTRHSRKRIKECLDGDRESFKKYIWKTTGPL